MDSAGRKAISVRPPELRPLLPAGETASSTYSRGVVKRNWRGGRILSVCGLFVVRQIAPRQTQLPKEAHATTNTIKAIAIHNSAKRGAVSRAHNPFTPHRRK